MALSGLPDATATQQVLDWMDVLCPYSNHGCSWVGPRRDILVHMKKKCIIGVDPETGTPALGALDIADFCLEETWIPHGIPIPTTSSPSLHAPSLASVSVDPIATSHGRCCHGCAFHRTRGGSIDFILNIPTSRQ
ncbi:hypothetical protein BASA81_007677 [Batrachochytrium salamandrivorans]|nr:hypothetical protein BASA81_007677 [Batrachochytrium salamandrivorans]